MKKFDEFRFNRLEERAWQLERELTLNYAQRSCVADQRLHSVAHNNGLQDEQMREGFIPSDAPRGKADTDDIEETEKHGEPNKEAGENHGRPI